ncbi:MAG: hypothetical protein ACM3PY_11780 [Omnitrophica WOR_2 bacterium]
MDIPRKGNLDVRNLKWIYSSVLFLVLAVLSAVLLSGSWSGLFTRPGFLGTRAQIYPDINLTAQFLLLLGLSLGVFFARTGHITAHQYTQTSMVLLNLVLAFSIMVQSFLRSVVPGLPGNLTTLTGLISTTHAVIGSLAILCGIYLLLRMNKILPRNLRIAWWESLMRLTFALYWIAGILGFLLYYAWYVR